jgi:hypothetical protein
MYYMGQGGQEGDIRAVVVGDVYTLDETTGTYAKQPEGTSLAATVTAGGDCTCNNFLREIDYLVDLEKITPSDTSINPYYSIKKITATVVLASNPVTSKCGEK